MKIMETIKTKALELIARFFGSIAVKSYAKFYEEKGDPVVLASINELLKEYLGEIPALELLKTSGLQESLV